MNFYYWSPFISNVATVKAVINSAISIKKFSQKINPTIINAIGEWNEYEEMIKKNKINILNFRIASNFYEKLPRFGFVKSRFSYLLISFYSIINLYSFLKKREKSDYVILHLLTSLPLILIILFNFKCKFILRISGFPKLNFLRKTLWKFAKKKLHKISTPTNDTRDMLIDEKIFASNSILLVRDPIVNIVEINKSKREKILENLKSPYLLTIGRLTKQKNHKFLINNFKVLKNKYKELKLVILGQGELEQDLKKISKSLDLNEDILFLGYKKNVFKYLENSMAFVLTSEWEDPGFVLIEAASTRTTIISSNCKNGPKEFLSNGDGGYLYEKGNSKNFEKTFDEFYKNFKSKTRDSIKIKNLNALKKTKNYTKFNHYKELIKII